jgi:hypothetical protein
MRNRDCITNSTCYAINTIDITDNDGTIIPFRYRQYCTALPPT